MRKWLHKMQNKSEMEKRSFALLSSFLISLIILALYLLSSVFTFNNQAQTESQVASPFQAFYEKIQSILESTQQ